MLCDKALFFSFLVRKVKVYSTTSYKVVHSFDYTASILSLALAVSILLALLKKKKKLTNVVC